jgi:hypothetical protein
MALLLRKRILPVLATLSLGINESSVAAFTTSTATEFNSRLRAGSLSLFRANPASNLRRSLNRLAMSTATDVIPGRPTWQQTMLRIKDPEKSLKFYTELVSYDVALFLLFSPSYRLANLNLFAHLPSFFK